MKYQDEKMDDFLVKLTKIVKQNENKSKLSSGKKFRLLHY